MCACTETYTCSACRDDSRFDWYAVWSEPDEREPFAASERELEDDRG